MTQRSAAQKVLIAACGLLLLAATALAWRGYFAPTMLIEWAAAFCG